MKHDGTCLMVAVLVATTACNSATGSPSPGVVASGGSATPYGAGGSQAPSFAGPGGSAPIAGNAGGSAPMGGVTAGSGGEGTTVVTMPTTGCDLGYSEHPDGHGGINVEAVCYTPEMGFDNATSLKAFADNVYPILAGNCSECHSTATKGQAPIHSDSNLELAHEYALTRVNFRKPADSKLVVRMGIDRHNCFGTNCRDANAQMLAAVTA